MAVDEKRALSFGVVAADYDRFRPAPSPEAVDWLVPRACRLAVDLAAGTGLFTRALAARVPEVIAVEPDARMRAVLADRSPGVHAVAGRGESMPLPDGSADGVFVSSAWHWMDPERAVPEIARVLRNGGRFGAIWTGRDRGVGWVRDLDKWADLRNASPPASPTESDSTETRRPGRRHQEVLLPDDSPFEHVEEASFSFVIQVTAEEIVGVLATYSGVIALHPETRADVLDQVRKSLHKQFPNAHEIDLPMRSYCWRADRISRA